MMKKFDELYKQIIAEESSEIIQNKEALTKLNKNIENIFNAIHDRNEVGVINKTAAYFGDNGRIDIKQDLMKNTIWLKIYENNEFLMTVAVPDEKVKTPEELRQYIIKEVEQNINRMNILKEMLKN